MVLPPTSDDPSTGTAPPYFRLLLRTLWPEPASITFTGRATPPVDSATDYIVVPNERHPKLLLPRRPRRATAAALRNYKASATGRTRLKLQMLSAAARLGLAETLPHRVRIQAAPGPESGIDRYLSTEVGRELLLGLYIGPSRAVQKPVLQILTPGGETFGFAKVSVNDLTDNLVRAEAESLAYLGTRSWSHLSVPRLLHHGQWRSREVLVQEAMSRSGSGIVDAARLTASMVELARSRGTTSYLASESPSWRAMPERLAALAPSPYVDVLKSAVERLSARAATTELEYGSWHGDWAPWNMTASDDRIMVWDWEQFETGVPLGFDAVHHHVQRAVVGSALAPEAAFESARVGSAELLSPFGVPPAGAELIVLLYAIEIATRYLHDGEVQAGTTMGSLAWLTPVLDRHLRLLDGAPTT